MTPARRITDRPRRPASLGRRTLDRVLFALLFVLAVLTLTGCNTLPSATLRTELAWQSANLVDGYQTSQYAHNDCHETGTWRYITGPEPSVERTALAAGINGALHFAVTWALERFDAPRGLKNAWAYTTLGLTGGQVVANASLGCD